MTEMKIALSIEEAADYMGIGRNTLRNLVTKLFDAEPEQTQAPKQETVRHPPKKEMQTKPKISTKPAMSSEAAVYPKLLKIYKELNGQNEIIFEAEKERNAWELERDDLKGFARFTKKGELQSKIDRKNEEIDILKIGLSGIAKRYGYQNVQDFYRTYHKAHSAYADYRNQVAKWEETYGEKEKSKQEKLLERILNYQKKIAERQTERATYNRDRGTR